METFISVIHVLTAITLIALVLLQDSKGGGVGGAFGGGSSNSILGATGGATLAQKMTRYAAVIFACTSIGLTILSSKRTSVIDNVSIPAASQPAATDMAPTDVGAPPPTTLPPTK